MDESLLTLAQLSDESGIEPRTIRSYIERGLLPSAQSRGRGAGYSADHRNRLLVIQYLRRLRPTATLSEIRVQLQQLTPQQIEAFASGSISAAVLESATGSGGEDEADQDVEQLDVDRDADEVPASTTSIEPIESPGSLTGLQRVVQTLRKASRYSAPAPVSKTDTWHRITVTEDIELCVRAGFDRAQIAAFRELADVLRHLINRPDAFPTDIDDD